MPIVLPATGYTKAAIEASGKKAVALVDKDGRTLAILRNPEIYENRKEEIVARCFGVVDMGHPYIAHIYGGGDWLLGGEIELLQKVIGVRVRECFVFLFVTLRHTCGSQTQWLCFLDHGTFALFA